MISSSQFTIDGKYLMLALDHRGSFLKLVPGSEASKQPVIDIKEKIVSSAYEQMSGTLVDPDFGLPGYKEYCSHHNIQQMKPFLLCMEESGYTDKEDERITVLKYSASQIKSLGASGGKLLIYYHPEASTAKQQLETAKIALEDCHANEIPLFLEIVTYELKGKNDTKPGRILSSVQSFIDVGIHPDVYKLEYPGDEKNCESVTKMIGEIPWILLTQGDPYETFKTNLSIAISSGAKGFLAGRSLWQEFSSIPTDQQEVFFRSTARERFEEIVKIALSSK